MQHSSLLNDCSFNGGNQFNFFLSLIVACHHFIFFSWSMCLCDPFSTRGIKEQFSYVCHLFFFFVVVCFKMSPHNVATIENDQSAIQVRSIILRLVSIAIGGRLSLVRSF